MTTAALLLAELGARGLRVRADGELLRLKPAEALTPELRKRILQAKPELLRLLASHPPVRQCLAVSEVLGFPAVLLGQLPIPTTLAVTVPGITGPVLMATHASCRRRSFNATEWLTLAALVESGAVDPSTFACWARGMRREQLTTARPAAASSRISVSRVLGRLGVSLRAVVLEGGAP